MKRVLLLALLLVLGLPVSASADHHHDVVTGDTGFLAHGTSVSPAASGGAATPVASNGVDGAIHEVVVCSIGGLETCGETALCEDGTTMTLTWFQTTSGERFNQHTNCPISTAAAGPPEVTPGLVLRAFRRVPLPASELVVQPPGGRTLVNFETNFYTEQGEFARVVRLLGRRVELRIWPESFIWRYGDGVSERTRGAGAPYPDLEITHRYLRRGRVAVRVDTTYAADFRVGAGGWRHVEGTVTIPGAAEGLRVVTARPVLVGG